jgi:hypothetical protein
MSIVDEIQMRASTIAFRCKMKQVELGEGAGCLQEELGWWELVWVAGYWGNELSEKRLGGTVRGAVHSLVVHNSKHPFIIAYLLRSGG